MLAASLWDVSTIISTISTNKYKVKRKLLILCQLWWFTTPKQTIQTDK